MPARTTRATHPTVIEQLTALQRFSVARKMNSRPFRPIFRRCACRFSHSTNVIHPRDTVRSVPSTVASLSGVYNIMPLRRAPFTPTMMYDSVSYNTYINNIHIYIYKQGRLERQNPLPSKAGICLENYRILKVLRSGGAPKDFFRERIRVGLAHRDSGKFFGRSQLNSTINCWTINDSRATIYVCRILKNKYI